CAAAIACSTLTVPVTFWVKVCNGRCTLWPAYLNPATCTTPTQECSVNAWVTVSVSRMEACTNGTPSETKVACPLDRSSTTTTSIPAARNARTTCAPM